MELKLYTVDECGKKEGGEENGSGPFLGGGYDDGYSDNDRSSRTIRIINSQMTTKRGGISNNRSS